MKLLASLPSVVSALLHRARKDSETDEELLSHIQNRADDHERSGMPRQEAERRARLEFGGYQKFKEECRDARGVSFLETLNQDVRFSLRMLAKSPMLTGIMAVTLGLGIGANAAIFSMVNAFLLRPLPVAAPEQITVLAIQQKDAPIGSSGFSYPEFVDFRRPMGTFSDVFGIVLTAVQLTTGDRSDECSANYVSGNFFSALGLRPAAGRFLVPAEAETPGGPLLVVLGYGYWQRRFGGNPDVVGRQIRIDGRSATIIGVGPKNFQGMYSIFEMDVFLPMSAIALEESGSSFWTNRDRRRILAFGRLKPGLSLRRAQSSLDIITARLAVQYPATDKWFTVRAIPEKLARPIPYANNSFVAISGLFLALATFVLLLACMNVENMLLARGAARQHEMAVRSALGAGRARLARQILTECLLLAMLGGATGMILGAWANHLTRSIRLQDFPVHFESTFDWRVFTFAAASALLTGVVVGMLPALRASSVNVNSVLHDGGRQNSGGIRHAGFRNFLVVTQVAGSFTLLVVAGLFVGSLKKVQSFDLGLDPNDILNVITDPHQIGYNEPRTATFYREIESRVRALPGVQSASLASYLPMGGWPTRAAVYVESHPLRPGQQAPRVIVNSIDPPYFETMRITLLRGRVFSDADNATSPLVAVINQTMARNFWPQGEALGKRFRMDGESSPLVDVVGVVVDGKYESLGEDPQPFFYVPLAQNFSSKRILQIRTFVPPQSLAASVQEEISHLAPELPIMDIQTMNQSLEGALGFFTFRLAATLSAALGVIGLILAVAGIYGVVSFTASQRTKEIGIRIALGADPRDILHLVWRQGMSLVAAGITLGTITALALTRGMAHMLVGIRASDPVTYAVVGILLSAAALFACWIPARRAMRADPINTLRHE